MAIGRAVDTRPRGAVACLRNPRASRGAPRPPLRSPFAGPIALAAAAAALLGPLQAQAAGCKLATIDVPVNMQGLHPLVTAKIGGQPVKLLLDSGAFFSTLDAKFAADAKLKAAPVTPTGSHVPDGGGALATGAAGIETMSRVVVAPTFEFAGAHWTQVQFLTARGFGEASGLLGQNFLHAVDNEFDLKNGVLKLVKADGCDNSDLAYWVKPGSSYSMAPLEATSRYDAHIGTTIEINGVRMHAYFDTGADTSFITARAAARAGVRTTDPAVTPAGYSHAIDGNVKTWVAPFASIKIGDEEIKNTHLAIGDSKAEDFDVLIGADFFMAHHVYVANSQRRIYFSYEGGPVFRVSAPDKATAKTPVK